MSGVNKVILVGRVGKEPEVKSLDNGNTVANFSLATSESYKDRTTGQRKETTEWHSIVCWKSLAEISQKYVHKGDLLYIEGKIRTRSWEKDGVTRYTTEVVADNMTMLGRGSQPKPNTPVLESSGVPANNSSDDLPF